MDWKRMAYERRMRLYGREEMYPRTEPTPKPKRSRAGKPFRVRGTPGAKPAGPYKPKPQEATLRRCACGRPKPVASATCEECRAPTGKHRPSPLSAGDTLYD